MTYRFRLNGIDIECDTIEELKAAANLRGPAKSWAEAEEYAKKHGVTRNEARSILAREKRKLMEEVMKKREKLM